ncbi:hypothetical protein [Myxococcus sp. AM010]|uniref:hypothetical protein n=1 Tax=Myxococcus sp. AM010 TaxID=2745138 RepID=UPI001595D233|nr:hypothetical protein [Myxococcus sp. AM010]NVJ14292.1 hypothetical protein [Myxococcus sp. AM010]
MCGAFHLRHEDHEHAIANIAMALGPGAEFLFTSGAGHGFVDDELMNGVPCRYHSYRVDGDHDLLRAYGLVLETMHAAPGETVYCLSRKTG